MNLPPGTRLRSLTAHADRRGWLFEAFRAEWEPDVAGAQVNVSSSAPGVLRGSHVHGRHTDYFGAGRVRVRGRAASART